MRSIRYPSSKKLEASTSRFEAVHGEARQRRFTGSLVLHVGVNTGVAVYLGGHPIYAHYSESNDLFGNQALDVMTSESGSVERHASTTEKVEMFLTYMDFINRDEGIMEVCMTEDADMRERVVDNPNVEEGEDAEIKLPEGVRLGYSIDKDYVRRFAREHGLSGYALSNTELLVFEDGEAVDSRALHMKNVPIRVGFKSDEDVVEAECEYVDIVDTKEAGSLVMVDYNVDGWEVVDTDREIEKKGGLLSRFLG